MTEFQSCWTSRQLDQTGTYDESQFPVMGYYQHDDYPYEHDSHYTRLPGQPNYAHLAPSVYVSLSDQQPLHGMPDLGQPFNSYAQIPMATHILHSQSRAGVFDSYGPHAQSMQRTNAQQIRRCNKANGTSFSDTEPQISEYVKVSEPLDDNCDGFPNREQFDEIVSGYVNGLSPKKQDKALIHSQRAANIKAVLIDTKQTSIESAQFRFWVKKMFNLLPDEPDVPEKRRRICHEGKPVAIQEKLYKILVKAHRQCQHGGRDKTSSQVRKVYSWVPKELISRFVKICPTCQARRTQKSGSSPQNERPQHVKQEARYEEDQTIGQYTTNARIYDAGEPDWTPQPASEPFYQQTRWSGPKKNASMAQNQRGGTLRYTPSNQFTPTMSNNNSAGCSYFPTEPTNHQNLTTGTHHGNHNLRQLL